MDPKGADPAAYVLREAAISRFWNSLFQNRPRGAALATLAGYNEQAGTGTHDMIALSRDAVTARLPVK